MADESQVLEAVLKETVDLESITIEEVFENLRCSKEGLTSDGARKRLSIFGHNKLEEKKEAGNVDEREKCGIFRQILTEDLTEWWDCKNWITSVARLQKLKT